MLKVKVFSATKAEEREQLGLQITEWMRANGWRQWASLLAGLDNDEEMREGIERLITSCATEFESFLDDRAQWSIETFGPVDHQRNARAAAISDHILKELHEIRSQPQDLEEWIDVISLALDGAMRCAGAASGQILPAMRAKLEKCKARTWPDWRTHPPGQATEHVREPHRSHRVTAADLAAVRAQELADIAPAVTISAPIEVRELPTLGGRSPRPAPPIAALPPADCPPIRDWLGAVLAAPPYVPECYELRDCSAEQAAECPGCLRHSAEALTVALARRTAERDEARQRASAGQDAQRIVSELRALVAVDDDGPEGSRGPSWVLGQIRQLLGIGITAEHDAVTLDLSEPGVESDELGGES